MAATSLFFYFSAFCLFLAILPESVVVSGHGSHDETSEIPHLLMTEIDPILTKRKEVLVFIHKSSCGEECEEHIDSLETAVQEVQLMGNRDAVHVIASTDEAYFKSFQSKKNVMLVFYRNGIPIIYEDIVENKLLHPETLVQWVADTRSLFVKQLTDDSFEHDTQAASGATTGDWFVLFYRTGCYDTFIAKLETLNYRFQGTNKVLAKVNLTENKELEKRFGIIRCPTFILKKRKLSIERFEDIPIPRFRNGKMYEYEQQKYDVDSLHNFATTWFNNAKSKSVPIERSPFDLIVDYAVGFIKRHHGAKEKVAFAAVATIIAVLILVKISQAPPKIPAKME